jgi:hypothetical protein
MRTILLISLVALLAASCTTTKSTTTKSMDIYGSGVIQHPVIAELRVDKKKVTGMARSAGGQNVQTVKNNAIADALKTSGADILVEPIFETETSGSITYARVTGFPGYYENFRPAEARDSLYLDKRLLLTAKTSEPVITESKTGSRALMIVGGTIAGLAALIALLLSSDTY